MEKPIYRINGNHCTDFIALISEFDRVFGEEWGNESWRGNLDAFNDLLDWPSEGAPYVLIWSDSAAARRHLGHQAMAAWLRNKLSECQPGAGLTWKQELQSAESGQGRTLFDWLVEIIRDHPQIELRLE